MAALPGPPDGRLLREGVLGEAFLRTWLGDGSEAAAAGWGGDAFRCFDCRAYPALWRSEWDSPSEAQEFLEAAERRLLSLGPATGARRASWSSPRGDWRFGLRSHRGGVELVSADAARLRGRPAQGAGPVARTCSSAHWRGRSG